ncbi:FtsP/CotA-like multicopper oxidase with cupredoxin domain [Friedmanniella endophytica]|uniref:FtsP/CotA-like multicopper oxidase with cupredoxin domain n=1 Tax=Microlunatus kandeliicorticis TaxID=1759536 RepID=A0A7W3P5G6_9ACTN|nr:multicopper oxidase family protein [Microlunatus kandeliicorticis]MBA8793842.1 FtsP/CotA-like multicopper oxidase with cupredoxin domain [Microlunatus kandeliicorticis]
MEPDQPAPARRRGGRRLRLIIPIASVLLVITPLGVFWYRSLTGSAYSAVSMGDADWGGGPGGSMAGMAGMDGPPGTGSPAVPITTLVADPKRPADVRVDLVARQQTITVGGQTLDGYTLNGRTPGPTITATQGQLVEVRVHNASVARGLTLHWHGVDVPNAEDGVAGVTQDDIGFGQDFTYRFVADQVGTFWYHSHQVSDAQVAGGLLGALVVRPRGGGPGGSGDRPVAADVVALAHGYGAVRTLDGRPGDQRVPVAPGATARVRVINTDNGPMAVWSSSPYTVVAVDGTDVHRPTAVTERYATVTAGGRLDLAVTAPADGSAARVQIGTDTAVLVGRGAPAVPVRQPSAELDLLSYGAPAALPFDPARATRHFTYSIGRRPGFVHGRPGIWWSINGRLYPRVPMFMVRTGDVVIMDVSNHSGQVHPMHLHGHHAVVLSRNGVAATGSPWWVDSLNVRDGESYVIAFRADNPGIWMDHCHNLTHASQGMVAHLAYEGYSTPFTIGGPHGNDPE